MKKNDLLTAVCDETGCNGEGIFHVEGTTFFVPYCLPGELVTFRILKIKNGVGYGKITEIRQPSLSRVVPDCHVFGKCGGCQLMHAKYEAQLKIKENTVKTAFKKIAAIDVDIKAVYPSHDIFRYRNKLQLPVREVNNVVHIGFYRESSHDIVDIEDCVIQDKSVRDVISVFKDFIDGKTVTAYNEITKRGTIKHIVVRTLSGGTIVTIVSAKEKISGVNRLIARLSEIFDNLSVYLNINKKDNNVIFGDRFILLYGGGTIPVCEGGISYRIGPESFLQVNDSVKAELYSFVKKYALPDEDSVIIDGYSGAGVLTAILAKSAKKAYGIEIVKEASVAAENLAAANGLADKMVAICAPCEVALPQIIGKENSDKTVLILDPPRKGVDLPVLSAALLHKPAKIIYIACSPQSLARDTGILTGTVAVCDGKITGLSPARGEDFYRIDSVELFDMFPQTKHVETLVVLSRKKA